LQLPAGMIRIACPILLGAILLGPAAARADEGTVLAPEGRWYGWELALSDAVFLLVATDGNTPNPELPIGAAGYPVGLAGLVVGAPALHYLHGNSHRARVGLLVRGLTVPLWALVQTTLSGQSDNGPSGGDFLLAGLGVAAAATAVVFAFIDDIWYARAPAPAHTTALAPTWFMNRAGGGIGLVGVF
jgi:hypothetical protein